MSGRQVVPGSREMQEEGTQYRQRPWATRPAAARVVAEQVRGDLGRGVRGPADADIQPALGELTVLLGHAGLDLVEDQAGGAGLNFAERPRDRSAVPRPGSPNSEADATPWPPTSVSAISAGRRRVARWWLGCQSRTGIGARALQVEQARA